MIPFDIIIINKIKKNVEGTVCNPLSVEGLPIPEGNGHRYAESAIGEHTVHQLTDISLGDVGLVILSTGLQQLWHGSFKQGKHSYGLGLHDFDMGVRGGHNTSVLQLLHRLQV